MIINKKSSKKFKKVIDNNQIIGYNEDKLKKGSDTQLKNKLAKMIKNLKVGDIVTIRDEMLVYDEYVTYFEQNGLPQEWKARFVKGKMLKEGQNGKVLHINRGSIELEGIEVDTKVVVESNYNTYIFNALAFTY